MFKKYIMCMLCIGVHATWIRKSHWHFWATYITRNDTIMNAPKIVLVGQETFFWLRFGCCAVDSREMKLIDFR